MTKPATLRAHLELIRDRHALDDDGWCRYCSRRVTGEQGCPDYIDPAVAALALLDAEAPDD